MQILDSFSSLFARLKPATFAVNGEDSMASGGIELLKALDGLGKSGDGNNQEMQKEIAGEKSMSKVDSTGDTIRKEPSGDGVESSNQSSNLPTVANEVNVEQQMGTEKLAEAGEEVKQVKAESESIEPIQQLEMAQTDPLESKAIVVDSLESKLETGDTKESKLEPLEPVESKAKLKEEVQDQAHPIIEPNVNNALQDQGKESLDLPKAIAPLESIHPNTDIQKEVKLDRQLALKFSSELESLRILPTVTLDQVEELFDRFLSFKKEPSCVFKEDIVAETILDYGHYRVIIC
jgi:hypothetical protein